jgi:CubicO group peptidase (beta-lactamase class C family)
MTATAPHRNSPGTWLLLSLALFITVGHHFAIADGPASQDFSSLNRALDSLRTTYGMAGMSVVIVKNGTVSFSRGYGTADIARQIAITDSTLYRIASISKCITATALMQLYEQGRFGLDEDVGRYLGFALRNPNFPSDSITFRGLLSHAASLRDGSGYDAFLSATYNATPPPPLQAVLVPGGTYYTANMWSNNRAPSSAYFTYANIDYGVIGTLVEKISGERFDTYCLNHILGPLGMTASFNIQDIPNINNVAVLYRKPGGVWTPQADNYHGTKPQPRDLSGYSLGTNGMIFAPQGGLRVSAADLARFMLAHMNGGVYNGTRILRDTTVTRMRTPVWTFTGSNGDNYYGIFNRYGLGLSTTAELLPGQTLIGHPGEAYGLISDLYFSSDRVYGIIFITNGGARDPWENGVYSGWYRAEEDVFQAVYQFGIKDNTTGIRAEPGQPAGFNLEQNYPNPFNPTTTINFSVPSGRDGPVNNMGFESWNLEVVSLKVYDLLGQEVATLVHDRLPAGRYTVQFNASCLAAGVYFYRLSAGDSRANRRMVLLK